nr:MAG TPA: hypothetical protein [Caudoviricetes sp.]
MTTHASQCALSQAQSTYDVVDSCNLLLLFFN